MKILDKIFKMSKYENVENGYGYMVKCTARKKCYFRRTSLCVKCANNIAGEKDGEDCFVLRSDSE